MNAVNPDFYLRQVLALHAVDTGPFSAVRTAQTTLTPLIQRWANQFLLSVEPSGSFAKGTAVHPGTDLDLFISLSLNTAETLQQIYESLHKNLAQNHYQPKRQNVSIGVRVGNFDVDLVPAKRQSYNGQDHSLYSNRSGTWLQTNVFTHSATVRNSMRFDEIRLMKIWRNRRGLDFPSFYLELVTIRALEGGLFNGLSANVVKVLEFIRDGIETARIMDPANTNNVISETVTVTGKRALASAARAALLSQWEQEFV